MADNFAYELQFSYSVCTGVGLMLYHVLIPTYMLQRMDYSLFRSTKCSNLIYDV